MKTDILYLNISPSILLKIGNVLDNNCRENQNTAYIQ